MIYYVRAFSCKFLELEIRLTLLTNGIATRITLVLVRLGHQFTFTPFEENVFIGFIRLTLPNELIHQTFPYYRLTFLPSLVFCEVRMGTQITSSSNRWLHQLRSITINKINVLENVTSKQKIVTDWKISKKTNEPAE